jgi:hypothetical protein
MLQLMLQLMLLLLRLTLQKIFLLSGSLTRSYITTPRDTGSCRQQHGAGQQLSFFTWMSRHMKLRQVIDVGITQK